MGKWSTVYVEMLDDCESRDDNMNDWESGFCESIRAQLDNGRSLSSRQIEMLEKIWDRLTERG
jgi:hypothetical protein